MPSRFLRFWWVASLAFLAGVALLSARLTGVLVAKRLWVADVGVSPADVQKGEQVRSQDLSSFKAIEDRNVFNAHPKPPPPPESAKPAAPVAAPSVAQAPTVKTPLTITLIGTAVLEGGRSFALIQSGQELKLIRLGDEVAAGATLAAVRQDRISVDRGDSTEDFLLYPPESEKATTRVRTPAAGPPQPPPPPANTAPAAPAEQAADTVRQVGEDKWVVDARELEDASTNMAKLMTQIRVVPNFTDGQPDGFKVFAIRPGSLFAKIGLQNGDVLKRINGIEMQGPEQAMEAYQRLKDETSIQIDLVRRNENKTFSYEVR